MNPSMEKTSMPTVRDLISYKLKQNMPEKFGCGTTRLHLEVGGVFQGFLCPAGHGQYEFRLGEYAAAMDEDGNLHPEFPVWEQHLSFMATDDEYPEVDMEFLIGVLVEQLGSNYYLGRLGLKAIECADVKSRQLGEV